MTKRLLQLAGVTAIILAAAFAPAKSAQACIHECVILCSPGTHCCVVGGCAGCYDDSILNCPPA
jgi:hypothetical protein